MTDKSQRVFTLLQVEQLKKILLKKKFFLFSAALGLCCRAGFSLVAVSGGYSWLQCVGFSW